MYTKFCIQTDGHGISSIPQTFIGGYNKQTLLAFDRILVILKLTRNTGCKGSER